MCMLYYTCVHIISIVCTKGFRKPVYQNLIIKVRIHENDSERPN